MLLLVVGGLLGACGDSGDGAAAAGSDATGADQPRTVTVLQVSHTLSFLPLYVAQQHGYFEANGVAVEIADAPGDSAANMAALKGGDAWGMITSPEQAMIADAHDQDIRAVVALTDTSPQALVARGGFTSSGSLADDLRGKRVAVSTAGSATREVALETIRFIGLDPDHDVTVIEGRDPARLAALEAGEADFAFLSQPSLAAALQEGIVTNALVSTAEAIGHYHSLSLLVTGDEADSDPATVQAVADAIARAEQLIVDQPEEAFAVAVAEFPEVEVPVLRGAFDYYLGERFWSPDGKLTDEGVQRSKQLAATLGELDPGDIDVTAAVDRRFGY
jgi:NitT/TauT family transport system substrate-binding protein